MKLLDVVTTVVPRPDLGLAEGLTGTIVEDFDGRGPFMVEFADEDGRELVLETFRPDELVVTWSAPDREEKTRPETSKRAAG